MPAWNSLILLYDGTFDGFLSAVLEAYRRKPRADKIEETDCQQEFGARYEEIESNFEDAQRVAAGIEKTMGTVAYEKVWTAFLSDDPKKSQKLYQYICFGMKVGRLVNDDLTSDCVQAVEKMTALVRREAHKWIEFVRFGKLEGGIWYAKIAPQNFVLPMLMPHFSARFNDMPFLLHDETHQQVAVYDLHGWQIISDKTMQLPPYSAEEAEFRRLWRCFYDTVAIRERVNPALRRQLMPKKYWKNIIEMQPDLSSYSKEENPAALKNLIESKVNAKAP